MFQGQRGWFCGSVSHDLRQFWGRRLGRRGGRGGEESTAPPSGTLASGHLLGSPSALASTVAEGGTISDPRGADFLFSCDASHPDTLRYLKVTWGYLLGHEEPGVVAGSRRRLIDIDDRKRLETSKFSVLSGCAGRGRGRRGNSSRALFTAAEAWPPTCSSSLFPTSSCVFPADSPTSV